MLSTSRTPGVATTLRFIGCLAAVVSSLAVSPSKGEITVKEIKYEIQEGGASAAFRGYLAYDDTAKDKRPGILVCHEWWGCNEYAMKRARMLAEIGYVAFAVDMYGEGRTTTDPSQAQEWSGALYADLNVLRGRAEAGLKILKEDSHVDAARLGAIGYCMGGTVCLELARTGADLKAVTCFHTSGLAAPSPADNSKIKAKVLVCHGAEDGFVQAAVIESFHQQMRDAKIDYLFVSYGGAVHSFTNDGADGFGIDGVKYNAQADQRSWRHMRDLFEEAF